MKVIVCIAALIAVAVAYPAQEGAAYTREAILQAQNSQLIPRNAQIQRVEPGIELVSLENIPVNQQVRLADFLGSQVPPEVVSNLQRQFDLIGHQ